MSTEETTDVKTSRQTLTNSYFKVERSPSTSVVKSQMEFVWTGDESSNSVRSPSIETVISTNASIEFNQEVPRSTVAKRAYPHVYDPEGATGELLQLLEKSAEDASEAVQHYSEGDIEGSFARINFIAALLAKAYPKTAFNPSLGAVVSFVRRAAIIADPAELSQPSLMVLSKTLRRIADTPLLSLDDASLLVDAMERQGWKGEHPIVAKFVKALFDAAGPESKEAAQHQNVAILKE